MTKIRLAYVQEFIRHGIVRRYFRKAGCKRVTLPGVPGSPEFNAAYERALASLPKSETTTEGSIGALVAAYYKSDARHSGCAAISSIVCERDTATSA